MLATFSFPAFGRKAADKLKPDAVRAMIILDKQLLLRRAPNRTTCLHLIGGTAGERETDGLDIGRDPDGALRRLVSDQTDLGAHGADTLGQLLVKDIGLEQTVRYYLMILPDGTRLPKEVKPTLSLYTLARLNQLTALETGMDIRAGLHHFARDLENHF